MANIEFNELELQKIVEQLNKKRTENLEENLGEKVKRIKKCYPGWQQDKNITTEKDTIENIKEDNTKEDNTKNNLMSIIREALATNFDKLKNPNRFNTGQVKITMSTLEKVDIDQISDIDNNIAGYDRIRVFDSMDRKCDVTVINDGPNELYLITNRNGINHEEESWSQNEIMIYPGEAWKLYDIHELRIRSEHQGNMYRVTEDDIIATSTVRSVM